MGVMDILLPLILLGGLYYLHSTGQLNTLLQGVMPKPGGAAPGPAPAPTQLATPTPGPPGGGGRRGGGGRGGGGETDTAPAPASRGGGGGDEAEPDAPAEAPEAGAPPTRGVGSGPPGGGGGAPTGTTCPGGTACASSNGGSRNECDGINLKEYEATWCGTFSGDDLSIKTFGPSHSGSSCCWCILSVSPDGAFGIRHEGPHPTTSSKSGTTASIGKPTCIKAIVRSGSGGINLEGWGLVGGQWKKAFSYSGQCGDAKKSSTPAPSQQVSFRCDGSLNTTCATVAPIGGGGGGGAPAQAGGGGGEEEAGGGGEDSESNYAYTNSFIARRSFSGFRTRRRHYYV